MCFYFSAGGFLHMSSGATPFSYSDILSILTWRILNQFNSLLLWPLFDAEHDKSSPLSFYEHPFG